MKKIWVLGIVILFLGGTPVKAVEDEQWEMFHLNELERAAQPYLEEVPLDTNIRFEDGLYQVILDGQDALPNLFREALGSGVLLLCLVLLCALAEGMYSGTAKQVFPVISLVGALGVTVITVADVNSLIGLGRESLHHMESFSKILLPTMATATAVGGAPTAAAVRQMATLFFSDLLMTIINRLFLPMVYIYIATSTAYAAVGNSGLKRVAEGIKWVVTSVLTTLVLVFVSYLTVAGAISGSADALTVKATKLTMSGMVPVLGGILSDAAETVLVGAGILRNAIGVFGMLAVLSICTLPFLQLGIHYLVYKCTAMLTATVWEGRVTELIDRIGGAFGLVLGMTGACTLLLVISIVSSISMVSL